MEMIRFHDEKKFSKGINQLAESCYQILDSNHPLAYDIVDEIKRIIEKVEYAENCVCLVLNGFDLSTKISSRILR